LSYGNATMLLIGLGLQDSEFPNHVSSDLNLVLH